MILHGARFFAVVLAALSTAATAPFAQELPLGVRSTEKFVGEVTLAARGKTESVPVNLRELALSPGAKIEDLRLGGQGVLVVELRIGAVITEIDGDKQVRGPGEIFIVLAEQKIGAATTGDRSAVVATLLLPGH
jgi:hypothetical protein